MMRVTDCWVLRKMDVRCSLYKLLLFQILVTWCGAKHVTIALPKVEISDDVDMDVQDSIRNLIHTGIYSHRHLDTSQVQVTVPVKVSRDGELVSRAVEHSHEHGHARARRDLFHTEHKLDHMLHYNLTVDGRQLRLDLRPSVTFITPAMVVERHRARERTRQRPHADATSCHYTGAVRDQPASRIALSACDGLAGLLRTEHGEYWIEPSTEVPSNSTEGRPHIIFKRSAVDKVKAFQRDKREIDNKHKVASRNVRNNHQTYTRRYNKRTRPSARRDWQRKETLDKQRREMIEQRRKQMEMLRRNPVEYRRQQAVLRIKERRTQSNSKSNSIESKSVEESFKARRNRNRYSDEHRLQRIKNRRRRRHRSKNCATKEPSYLWRKQNMEKEQKAKQVREHQNTYRNTRRYRPGHRAQLNSTRRTTRSVSKPRHVEVLLVADKSMSEFHDKLETYLLTIMNMVSSLYMDPSIGNYIKVVVVKIILVEETDAAPDLEVSTNADITLASFCRWQQQLNPDDDANPHHHDVAILVTRQDICSQHDMPCSTLGVAHVAGMCKPDRSCSVNEDNGIMLAHTITHELGHNFGLYHDTEKIGCHRREGSTLHIMTPIFEADTVQVAWSRCSKRDVTNFLDAGLGECLSDRPSEGKEYPYPEVQAGELFDAASQCHLQFGSEAIACSNPTEPCKYLWCQVNETCKTMLRPPAPGTTCGLNMWCQNQTCVPRIQPPEPRDGGWGPWSDWSECSRTCGAGVSTQSRECNNPEPNNNGKYCIGDRSRYKICNTEPCPINEPSFREVQCSKHNNMTYNNETISEWIPYFDQDKPCELQCVSRDDNVVEMLGGFVVDGTPCRQSVGARDMCIADDINSDTGQDCECRIYSSFALRAKSGGDCYTFFRRHPRLTFLCVCYKVGCDWIVDSDKEEDECGVCGGNGSACKTVKGLYSIEMTKQSGFSEVAVIPAGSRNVKIQEKVSPGNYISIGSAKSNRIYMNGARNATLTEYFVAGTQAIYERDRDWEKVQIAGPLAEDIKVYQRIHHGRHRNPGVNYQYTVDRQRAQRRRSYRLSPWSPCSTTCGAGYMSRNYECVDEHQRPVEQSQCYHIEPPRHEALMQQCQSRACAAPSTPSPAHFSAPHKHWWVGVWQPCSKPCHMPGEEATKQRTVYCVDKLRNTVIEDSECDQYAKPISAIKCADIPAC